MIDFQNSLYLSITTVVLQDQSQKLQTWSTEEKLLETIKILSKRFKWKLLSLVNTVILLQKEIKKLRQGCQKLSKIIFMISAGYSPKQYLWFLFKKKKAILAIYSAPMIKTPTSKLDNPAKWQMTKHTLNYWCKQVCIQAKWLTRLELIPVSVSWSD